MQEAITSALSGGVTLRFEVALDCLTFHFGHFLGALTCCMCFKVFSAVILLCASTFQFLCVHVFTVSHLQVSDSTDALRAMDSTAAVFFWRFGVSKLSPLSFTHSFLAICVMADLWGASQSCNILVSLSELMVVGTGPT